MGDLQFSALSSLEIPEIPPLYSIECRESLENFEWAINRVSNLAFSHEMACQFSRMFGRAEVRAEVLSATTRKKHDPIPESLLEQCWNEEIQKWSNENDHGNLTERLDAKEVLEYYGSILSGICVIAWSAVEVFLGEIHSRTRILPPWSIDPNKKFYYKRGSELEKAFKALGGGLADAVQSDDVRALASVRHALAHRGSMDNDFKKTVENSTLLQSHYPNPQPGDSLNLTGPFVCRMVDLSVRKCYSIAMEMDQMMNPTT